MISALVTILLLVLIIYIVLQLLPAPTNPAVRNVVWAIAVIIILLVVLDLFGIVPDLRVR